MSKLAIYNGEKTIKTDYDYSWPPISEAEVADCTQLMLNKELAYYGREGKVKELEDKFMAYHGTKYAIATSTGTQALHSAFFALGIGPGDEVIAPTYTFLATVTPIFQCYAKPVLCDAEPDTGNIDPEKIKNLINEKTKAIVITHMWGHPCDMDAIVKICKDYGLYLIEDCSHAHGATYKGKKVGTFGDVGCFSLQSAKIISAGCGGILITNNQELHDRATLVGHFRVRSEECVELDKYKKYAKTGFGMNYRMHPLGAAMASRQMDELDERIHARRTNLDYLTSLLAEIEGIEPPITRKEVTRGAYYGYKPHYIGEQLWGLPLEAYVEALQAEGLKLGKPGSKPLHLLPAFQQQNVQDVYSFNGKGPRFFEIFDLGYKKGDLPISEQFYQNSLSLPTFTGAPNSLIEEYAEAFYKVSQNVDQIKDWWRNKTHEPTTVSTKF